MELLFILLLICIIIFALIIRFKIRKKDNSIEVKCLVCEEPLISSNYNICYRCRVKQSSKHKNKKKPKKFEVFD